jgi:hypothetical protein
MSRVLVLTTALLLEALAAQGSQRGDSTAVESQAVRSFVVPSREIRGIVLDAATGKPLSDAQVFVEQTTRGALTDSSGRFVVRDVPTGPHGLVARRIAYASTRVTVEVDEESGWAVRFSLAPSMIVNCGLIVCAGECHSITVYVWDVLTGRPPRTPVALRVSQDTLVYWDQGQADSTARTLRLSAGFGDGRFTVEVAARGYAPWRRSGVWVERGECGLSVGQPLQIWLLPVDSPDRRQ